MLPARHGWRALTGRSTDPLSAPSRVARQVQGSEGEVARGPVLRLASKEPGQLRPAMRHPGATTRERFVRASGVVSPAVFTPRNRRRQDRRGTPSRYNPRSRQSRSTLRPMNGAGGSRSRPGRRYPGGVGDRLGQYGQREQTTTWFGGGFLGLVSITGLLSTSTSGHLQRTSVAKTAQAHRGSSKTG